MIDLKVGDTVFHLSIPERRDGLVVEIGSTILPVKILWSNGDTASYKHNGAQTSDKTIFFRRVSKLEKTLK